MSNVTPIRPEQPEKPPTISELQWRLFEAKSWLRGAQALAHTNEAAGVAWLDIEQIIRSATDVVEDVAEGLGEHC